MPTLKRDHEDVINNNVNNASKDVPQSKKLRKKAFKNLIDAQKQPLTGSIAETFCQGRFVSVGKMGSLSKLPYELLVEIAKRLRKVEDFTCFRGISRTMNFSVKEEYFEGLRFRKSLPYLMLPPDMSITDGNNNTRRQFYSLVEGESIVASLDFPAFKTSSKMYFESLGWFLTIEVDGSMSLLDPFSNTEIPLPHLHTFPRLKGLFVDRRILIRKMVLSSRPNENADFIMMVIIGDCGNLAFWRLGDKAWNKIDDRNGYYDVVYGGGEQFYAIRCMGSVSVINVAAGLADCRILINCEPVLTVQLGQGQYILKAIDGSVLCIMRSKEKKFYLTSEFKVYDINIGTGTWKEIYSLGSMAVFLGRNSSFAVDATTTNGVVKANHIYYTDDYGEYQSAYFRLKSDWRCVAGNSQHAKGGSVDCGVYNFETGDVEPIYPVKPLLRNVCPAMWITPNLCS